MIFSYFIERKRYSWPLVTAVLVLIVGAVMAVPFGNPSATPFGLLLATTSMLATSTKPVMAAVLMKDVEHTGLSPLVLVWCGSPCEMDDPWQGSHACQETGHVSHLRASPSCFLQV